MERREHHRAQLRLPVRLRWSTPFGQKIEVCETLDVSRGGLRVPCGETHAPGVPLWVTFPYDVSLGDGQPEMLAKVVRASRSDAAEAVNAQHNGSKTAMTVVVAGENSVERPSVALHFELTARAHGNGNGHAHEPERRSHPRRRLAVPIRVRAGNVPWFEEAMTLDVSADGVRFLSNREYQSGEHLFISFASAATAPWIGAKEFRSRVVRADAMLQSAALAISLARLP
jgi:PilZ domain